MKVEWPHTAHRASLVVGRRSAIQYRWYFVLIDRERTEAKWLKCVLLLKAAIALADKTEPQSSKKQ
jgi:hypothetical protein